VGDRDTIKAGARARSRSFVPTKGGDGGPVAPDTYAGWSRNAETVLAGASLRGTPAWAAFEAGLIEAIDPADRAHAMHGPSLDHEGRVLLSEGERLLPAHELERRPDGSLPGSPRRYPSHQMVALFVDRETGRRVGLSIDSAADSLVARATMLEREGVSVGIGVLRSSTHERAPRVDEIVERLGREAARRLVGQRTRCELTPEEIVLEQRAAAMLAEAGASRRPRPSPASRR
jgi:hypothetical protein